MYLVRAFSCTRIAQFNYCYTQQTDFCPVCKRDFIVMLCEVCISRTTLQNLKNSLDILKMLLLYNVEVYMAVFVILCCNILKAILNNESDLFRLCGLQLCKISSRVQHFLNVLKSQLQSCIGLVSDHFTLLCLTFSGLLWMKCPKENCI